MTPSKHRAADPGRPRDRNASRPVPRRQRSNPRRSTGEPTMGRGRSARSHPLRRRQHPFGFRESDRRPLQWTGVHFEVDRRPGRPLIGAAACAKLRQQDPFMAKPACPLCDRRRGRRSCPALGESICSACCGTKRRTQIACPPDCVYLESAAAHPPAVVQRRRERDGGFLAALLHGLTGPQQRLTAMLLEHLAGRSAGRTGSRRCRRGAGGARAGADLRDGESRHRVRAPCRHGFRPAARRRDEAAHRGRPQQRRPRIGPRRRNRPAANRGRGARGAAGVARGRGPSAPTCRCSGACGRQAAPVPRKTRMRARQAGRRRRD